MLAPGIGARTAWATDDAFQSPSGLPLQVEAVRGTGWDDAAPPQDGWQAVTLPDSAALRWPTHDGVIWYRLRWTQPAAQAQAGLMLQYLNMAGSLSVNGMPIWRDHSLVEPLTRSWNTPRQWLLAPPLLRPGEENTLLIRVAGLAAYQPGLGPVTVAAPAVADTLYAREQLLRRDLQILGLSISSIVTCLFGLLWLLRRNESAYGWFALMSLLWLLFGLNQVVTSPWPFPTTDGWQATNTSLLLAFVVAFTLFTLRFADRRWPWVERGLMALALLGIADLTIATFVAPATLGLHRAIWTLLAVTMTVASAFGFVVHAVRTRTVANLAMVPFMVFTCVSGVHDLLVFLQVVSSNRYYSAMAAYAMLLGMALILSARFVRNLRRIEGFNTELRAEVDAAKAELGATLAQRHALELAHARIGERVSLVSDLHDGLGGMLVGSIATLEHAPDRLEAPELLAVLRRLRDDLRLIIDTTGFDNGEQTLAELLAPLRHRTTQWLEANGIGCRWQIEGTDALRLAPSHSLDILRFVQEALTNALKHSGARQVQVRIAREGPALDVSVQDDGRGFADSGAAAPASGGGTGLRSLRARAARLGAAFVLEPVAGRTRIGLHIAQVAGLEG